MSKNFYADYEIFAGLSLRFREPEELSTCRFKARPGHKYRPSKNISYLAVDHKSYSCMNGRQQLRFAGKNMYKKKPLRRERRGQLGKKLIQPPLRSGTKLSHPVKASFLIRQLLPSCYI